MRLLKLTVQRGEKYLLCLGGFARGVAEVSNPHPMHSIGSPGRGPSPLLLRKWCALAASGWWVELDEYSMMRCGWVLSADPGEFF